MNMYRVTFDYLIGGKYREAKPVLLSAKNKKEACQAIKNRYWETVNSYVEKGYSTTTARRFTHYPFHITAYKC